MGAPVVTTTPATALTEVMRSLPRRHISGMPVVDRESIVNCFASQKIRRFPIIEDGKIVGIVGRRDILREMSRLYNGY